MEKKSPWLPVIILLLSSLYFFCLIGLTNDLARHEKNNSQIRGASDVTVSTTIGEYHFTLFGYTSPQALVTIEGMGIYDNTYADQTGYFMFNNRFSPFSPREACLTTRDQFGRTSPPVCLAPFPTSYNVSIGPVILPATASLNQNDYFIGDEVLLSGQTIPDRDVNLSVFIDEKRSLLDYLAHLTIVKPAVALNFPQLITRSDDKGNFSLSIPSSYADFYRLFTRTNFQDSLSPKSLTLNLKVLPFWMIVIRIFTLLLSIIKSRIIEVIIFVEMTVLFIYFLRQYFHPHTILKNKALIIRQDSLPMIKEDFPLLVE